ncbi:hypothetical protein RM697_05480 [Ichthyenterobacterium sp. W332]|uniref:Protein involved in gliding motility SprE n=1 Tax=Microcosmobacter mediterraneus TaxID=3075607 RepID=A0ABU2YLE4_9FLAO|nr:hypothetical protein [Ichthyenterobacterium sp. W332]MDT0558085.1 hypothetical protein [Ichthyenterobacterium sp. W332]
MKLSLKTILLVVGIAFIATNCSRKKDTFLSRNFHALGTKYNILYNGNIALEQGKASINDAFTENFWELLPVERMQVTDEVILPGQSKNADFERAEEKAIKAVQKHGMNIQGKEKNPQIDEAYLLLGKSRYFDQRFIPALEAFNYILYKYPASDKINSAKVWREKTNIRLENNELAIKNLKRLLEQEELEPQDLADATSILAQAYINLKHKDSALQQLKVAETYTKNNNEIARYNYIRGQLYNEFGHKDSANMAFDKIIELHRKIPRAYYINAHLEKIKNFNYADGDKLAYLEYLTDLEEDRENRPFLDKIYHHIANFHLNNDKDSLATVYYNKSLAKSKIDKVLNTRNYATLGDMSFDVAKYKTAGAYYDSTMTNMKLNSKPYRLMKKKRDNLDDVIYYEDIAQRHDSILNLVSLSEEDRLAVFSEFTEQLRIRVEQEKAKQLEAEEAAKRQNSGINQTIPGQKGQLQKGGLAQTSSGRVVPGKPGGNGKSNFYFYNQNTVSFGKNEFLKIWGERDLQDGWRLSDKRGGDSDSGTEELIAEATDEELFDPQFYISKIPSDPKVIDSLTKDRNFAYYQLGTIYKEKFKEYELAKNKLQRLLQNIPEERLVLPTKYNLYKLYILLNQTGEAEAIKSDILANYSDSRYAEILRNPESALASDENSPESLYEKAYRYFENQDYTKAIAECEKHIYTFEGEPIVPKFEILKASARGRLYGVKAYEEGVNYVALTYPNSEEGKKALEILNNSIPLLSKKQWYDNDSSSKFHVVYQFKRDANEDVDAFIKRLNEKVEKVTYFDLSTSKDVYDENTIFVVVHGLKSIGGAAGFAEIIGEDKDEKDPIIRPYFSISSGNYTIIQRHKNLEEYIQSQ